MHIDDYLHRIGLTQRPRADLAGLTAIHRAHMQSIAYENLDVQLGCAVTIERAPILEKVVDRKRGGWCYEMNGTLNWALEELGFRVTRATGAVMREMMGDAATGNHLVLRVELEEGTYLADVGFGDGPLEPINLVEGEFISNGFVYHLSRADGDWWRLRNHPAGAAPSFDFNLERADETKFAARCASLQSTADSLFVLNLICFRHRPNGFYALLGRVLKDVRPYVASARTLESADELVTVLADKFGLDVPEAASLWPKICARHEAIQAARQAR
ncbi:MAG TPA: arylamine N-acetyltransferase [Rhizomicrobium sp.]